MLRRGLGCGIYDRWLAERCEGYLNLECGEEISLIRQQAEKIGGPILDVACGAGRVLMPLALSGYDVWGIEASEYMRDIGLKKISILPPDVQRRIHLLPGDMRDFSLLVQFGLALVCFNSFWSNLNFRDARKCLGQILRHLKPQGRFMIDTPLYRPTTFLRKCLQERERQWWDIVAHRLGFSYELVQYRFEYTFAKYNKSKEFKPVPLIHTMLIGQKI